jgi:hypothetical protein
VISICSSALRSLGKPSYFRSGLGNCLEGAVMKKNLYRVDVVLYIMAEDEDEACAAATEIKFDIFECSSSPARFIEPFWENSIPYNSDNNLTCKEILNGKNQVLHSVADWLNN